MIDGVKLNLTIDILELSLNSSCQEIADITATQQKTSKIQFLFPPSTMNEFILKPGNNPLPDVFLLQLVKQSHLTERDCVSLAVSGASGRFNFLFWDKR